MTTNKILSLGLGLLMAAAAVLPAAAATAPATKSAKPHHTYYYISHNAKGKGCEVVTHRPSKKMMVGKYYYATHKQAAASLKANKACH